MGLNQGQSAELLGRRAAVGPCLRVTHYLDREQGAANDAPRQSGGA
jgi:hypothetical protein